MKKGLVILIVTVMSLMLLAASCETKEYSLILRMKGPENS
jgi:hypothetical protein